MQCASCLKSRAAPDGLDGWDNWCTAALRPSAIPLASAHILRLPRCATHFKFIVSVFHSVDQLLDGHAGTPAFVDAENGNTVSRTQLRAAGGAAAHGLLALGFKRGDALAVWLPNGLAWLQLLIAAARIGVLIVPVSTRYKAPEVKHLLNVSRARGIVTAARFLDMDYAAVAHQLTTEVDTLDCVLEVDDLAAFMTFESDGTSSLALAQSASGALLSAPDGAGADLLCCFSTSGTTGFPKLAAHSHASIARHAHYVARSLDMRAGDATLCVLPFFGVFGFMTVLATLAAGATCVSMPVYDATEAAHAIACHRISHVIGADTMFDAMMKIEGADFATWRRAVQADFAGLAIPVTQRGSELGIAFTGTYGSSECYSLMSFQDFDAGVEQRAKAGGVPVDPGITVRICDAETGRVLGAGEPGEIQIRGPNVLAQYLNNPEATAKSMTADGWFRSGDLGFVAGGGFVYLARMGDSLRLRGYLVSPAEIENCLMQHASVGGAQVVGAKQPGQGDVAVAYVVSVQPAAPDEAILIAHCRANLAAYKVPVRVIVIDEFPALNGPNGNKIQKRVLREWAQRAIEA